MNLSCMGFYVVMKDDTKYLRIATGTLRYNEGSERSCQITDMYLTSVQLEQLTFCVVI